MSESLSGTATLHHNMDGSELKVGFIDFFLFVKDALDLAATKTLPVQSTIVDQFHLNSAVCV